MCPQKRTSTPIAVRPTRLFHTAKLKIERAEQHIIDLEKAFALFKQSHPHTLRVSTNPATGDTDITADFSQPLPPDLALIIGDAVHNLRSALDHANWELRRLYTGEENPWALLLVRSDCSEYKTKCDGIKNAPRELIDFFKFLEICENGRGKDIYALHLLDNDDKHMILTPVACVSSIRLLRIRTPNGGVIQMENCAVSISNGVARIAQIGAGASVDLDKDADTTIEIFFGNVQGFPFRAVFPTLIHLTDAVNSMIREFEAFVAQHPPI